LSLEIMRVYYEETTTPKDEHKDEQSKMEGSRTQPKLLDILSGVKVEMKKEKSVKRRPSSIQGILRLTRHYIDL